MFSHVIWDFNGTIFDDVDVGIKSANELLKRQGLPLLESRDQYRDVFDFPIIDYYRKLGLVTTEESYNELAPIWVDIYNELEKSAKIFDGVEEKLRKIKDAGIKQIILSATETQMLKGQVKRLGIYDYFDEVLGLDNIRAYSKVEVAKEWIKKEKPQKAVFLGDTTHDYEVSKQIGVDCILIANGHQSRHVLEKCGTRVVDSINDIDYIIGL
ncbi:MAG: HAD hydrolase-like protein [Clostridia bacterium]|nr:HAD hydrolase-like protein [Clostridia bacterium]